jgi:putative addiction module component
MAATWEQLAEEAMTLPSESRARLADRLVESLDVDELGAVDQLWVSEATRRRDEVRTGKVQPINGEEALRKVRNSLR